MDVLAGKMLMRKDGEMVSADEVLSDVEVIGFYFSAHWCPPCRFFTPVLAEFHASLKEAGEPFEVVFISSDETKEEMLSYMNESHGDWLAVPFGEDILRKTNPSQSNTNHTPTTSSKSAKSTDTESSSQGDRSPDTHKAIKKKFYVNGIPTLIIAKKEGERITNNGRGDIDEVGPAAWKCWKEGKGIVPEESEEEEEEEGGGGGGEEEEKKEEEDKAEEGGEPKEES